MANNTDITKYVARKIKYYRELKNITQQEVAEFIGTTQQSIARYESGERKTDNNILFSLADLFGVSVNDFFPPISYRTEELYKDKDSEINAIIHSDMNNLPDEVKADMLKQAMEEKQKTILEETEQVLNIKKELENIEKKN